MKKLYYLTALLLFSCGPVYAGDFTTSITHDFQSREGKTANENGKLSVNYNTPKAWADGSIGYNKLQGIKSETFLGAGYKYRASDSIDWSAGLLWKHDTEDACLGSVRVRYRKRFVLFYQPYLSRSGYIVKANMAAPSDVGLSLVYGLEYRSSHRWLASRVGVKF